MTRRDLLESAVTIEAIIFPVFTNGTLIGALYTEDFKRHLNIVPVNRIETEQTTTDNL